jgi:hypothetical protein
MDMSYSTSSIEIPENVIQEVRMLFHSGHSSDSIGKLMESNGISSDVYESALKLVKKEHYEKRRSRGVVLLGVGGILLLSGFVISAIMFHSNGSPTFALYGLTSVGIGLIVWGMADCLGL